MCSYYTVFNNEDKMMRVRVFVAREGKPLIMNDVISVSTRKLPLKQELFIHKSDGEVIILTHGSWSNLQVTESQRLRR